MAESQYISVIKVWAALVWADGKVTPQEASAMKRLINGSELTDSERESALRFLEHKVELETTGLESLSAIAREGIYRAAVKLSAIDNDMADSEIDFLAKLRGGLSIDDATAEKIEDSVASGG